MKRIKISSFAVLAASLLAMGCQDNRESNMVPNEVYVVNSDKVVATLYNTGADAVFNIGVTKSGYVDVSATADIVVSAQALATYNAKNSLTLKMLPEDCYSIVSNKVTFADDQVSALYPIVFKTDKLLALGADLDLYCLPLELTQSNLQINFDKKFSILMPQIKPAVMIMDYSGENAMTVDKSSKTLLANLPVSVPFVNNWNIACTFTSTVEDFNTFNASKGGALTMIPEDAFTITPAPFSLAKGKQKGEIFVSIDRSKLSYASYCLPVRLASTDMESLVIDPLKAVSYLTVNTLQNIDRTTWTIANRSSEEADNPVSLILDNDIETFWHSNWTGAGADGATEGKDNWVTIDMGKNYVLGSLLLTLRQNNAPACVGYVEVADDLAGPWTYIGNVNVSGKTENLASPLVPTKCRYFKFFLPGSGLDPNGNKINPTGAKSANAMIAEIKAMGGPAE